MSFVRPFAIHVGWCMIPLAQDAILGAGFFKISNEVAQLLWCHLYCPTTATF